MLKYDFPLLGRRLTVRLQTLDLRIGVRIPASQPIPPIFPVRQSGRKMAFIRVVLRFSAILLGAAVAMRVLDGAMGECRASRHLEYGAGFLGDHRELQGVDL